MRQRSIKKITKGSPLPDCGQPVQPARGQKSWLRRSIEGYLFIGPAFLFLLVFVLGPMLFNFFVSFTDWRLADLPRFVGLDNYYRLIHDEIFRKALINTCIFALGSVPSVAALALFAAMMLNRKMWLRNVFRTSLYVPVISSGVVVAVIWKYMYNSEFGIINFFLSKIGISPKLWLASTELALPSLVIINIWKSLGFYMVIYLAGLQGLPAQLYDAAQIDGANKWQQFWYMTLPLLTPVTALVIIMLTIETFKIFDLVFIMTQGGPANSTTTLVNYIYQKGFVGWDLSYATAMSVVLLAIILLLSLFQYKGTSGRR